MNDIQEASEKDDVQTVKRLLADKHVDPSINNNYSIKFASNMGYVEIVKLLLTDDRVDPTADDNAAIHGAIVGITDADNILRDIVDDQDDPTVRDTIDFHLDRKKKYLNIIALLARDPRIQNKLPEILEKYKTLSSDIIAQILSENVVAYDLHIAESITPTSVEESYAVSKKEPVKLQKKIIHKMSQNKLNRLKRMAGM